MWNVPAAVKSARSIVALPDRRSNVRSAKKYSSPPTTVCFPARTAFPSSPCVRRSVRNAAPPLSPGAPAAGKDDGDLSAEAGVAVYRPSAMNYFWSILLGIITLPVFFGIFILLRVVIEVCCTRYELTTHRIIVRKGWIAKMCNEIWVKDMRAVNFTQGIWQRIIGVGDIAVGTAASEGMEIRITGIAKPLQLGW